MSLADLLTQTTPGDKWRLEYDHYEKYTDMPSHEDSTWVWRIEGICDFANEEGTEADARLVALAPDLAKLAIDNDRTFDWLEMALGSWAEFSGSRYSNEMLDVLAAIAAARARFAALDQRATT